MMHTAALATAHDSVFSSLALPRERETSSQSFLGIVSGCSEMHKVFNVIEKIAKTRSTVLVLGESGTGLLARISIAQHGRGEHC